MDNNAMTVISPAFELPGTAVVDVYAENLYNTKRYVVNYTVFTGVDDEKVPLVQVYPNPVDDQLFIEGLKDAAVKIFSIDGQQLISRNGFSGNTIDVSSLAPGIYVLDVVTMDGAKLRKKIVVY
jgi:hypothetical protein